MPDLLPPVQADAIDGLIAKAGQRRRSRFDLKRRLSISIAGLLVIVLGLSVAAVLRNSAQSVRGEIEAVMRLADRLVGQDIASAAARGDEAGWNALLDVLDDSRHLCVQRTRAARPSNCPAPMPTEVPRWFSRTVAPPTLELRREFIASDGRVLHAVIRADAADEVLEAWSEARPLLTAIALIGFLINAIVVVTVWFFLRPVDAIRQAIVRMSRGELQPPLPRAATPELVGIVEGLVDLGTRLRQAREDKHRLLRRNLELQESERSAIARELQDELGQGLAIIDANVSLLQQSLDEDAQSQAESQQTLLLIRDSVADCCDRLRAMLVQLRPSGLSEFGLGYALQSLIGNWERHCPHIRFESQVDPNAAPDDALTQVYVYRVAQEALTNAVRHSGARHVRMEFGTARGEPVCLRIVDDGAGLRETRRSRKGHGLRGIRERAEALGAVLDLQSPPSGGTQLELWLPDSVMQVSRLG
ncbi:histidine kinase [Hydrocarboniphaga effusa]|uniref:histidine kinase n=1 Tax=Hydrocarboniphaga effusa TaxID=243629 RepID=UPI0035B2D4E2